MTYIMRVQGKRGRHLARPRYGLGDREFKSRQRQDIFLYPNRPDRFWGLPGLLFKRYNGSKWQGRNVNHSPPSSEEIKNGWSVLGPLLFLAYVNDIWRNTESNIRLFADDCIIYRKIKDSSDVDKLQTDLNR